MKCKLATKTKGCYLKACTKIQWCKYEPWNIPRAGLSEGHTKRRMAQISNITRLIAENTPSYEAGYEAGYRSPPRLPWLRHPHARLYVRRETRPELCPKVGDGAIRRRVWLS